MSKKGWFRDSYRHSLASRGYGSKDGSSRGASEGGLRRNVTTECRHPDLKGGMAEGRSPREFDQKQLEKGIEIEMEHTDSPEIAQQIAMDHLAEHEDYYKYLPKMEKKLERKERRLQKKEERRRMKLERKKRGK